MKILVFGGTGRVGASLIEYALAEGHEVTAFVRDRNKVKLSDPKLEVFEGDIYQPERVESVMEAAFDAIFNVVGTDPLKPSTVVTDSARAILGTMTKTGQSRYLGITGTAQMPTSNVLGSISDWVLRHTPVGNAATDHDGVIRLVCESNLDWTLAGCPYIKDGEHTANYKIETAFPGGFHTISPQDVADFLLKELVQKRYPRQIAGIWY